MGAEDPAMAHNSEPVPEANGDQHPNSTAHTTPAYGRDNNTTADQGNNLRHNRKDDNVIETQGNNPRHTRKEKNGSATQSNNPRHTKKDKNVTVNQGNQFGALTDLNDQDGPPTGNIIADKNGSKSGSKSGSKGKSPMSRSTPQNPGRPPQPSTATTPSRDSALVQHGIERPRGKVWCQSWQG
nr:hypothetical protein Iba_chr01bCG4420 [Ipomoea batatas]